jgi:hypothetical protein
MPPLYQLRISALGSIKSVLFCILLATLCNVAGAQSYTQGLPAVGNGSTTLQSRGLAHAFTTDKSGCPVLLAFLARGRGF